MVQYASGPICASGFSVPSQQWTPCCDGISPVRKVALLGEQTEFTQ
jgi:hypothetical protein